MLWLQQPSTYTTVRNCQPIQGLLCRGLLVYDQQRHITLPHDKGPLWHEGGETLLDAYYQTTQRCEESRLWDDWKGNSHLITVSQVHYKWGSANYIVPNVSTVNSLLTHTCREKAGAMGYKGVWDIQEIHIASIWTTKTCSSVKQYTSGYSRVK